MFNLLQGASDDQVALIGCLVAVVGSAGLMYLSFFVGPAARKSKPRTGSELLSPPLPLRPAVDASHERAA